MHFSASYIHICKRNDPQVSKCVRESIEFLRPNLKSGINEIDVPALDPLKIPNIDIAAIVGTPTFRTLLQDISVYGASDFKLTKLKYVRVRKTFKTLTVIYIFF